MKKKDTNSSVKLSIITICYNEKRVKETCQSITGQVWQDFEWIVIDGGSNQETLDVFEQYRNRMDYFVSEKDNGVYHAMNKGIAQARGEYLIFMNAGDYFLDAYSLQRLYAREAWSEELIICDALFFNPNGASWIKQYEESMPIRPDYFIDNYLPHQSMLIRRDAFERYGGYNEKHRIFSDNEKWMELIIVHKVACRYINHLLSVYYIDGLSAQGGEMHRLEREEIMREYYPHLFDGTIPNPPASEPSEHPKSKVRTVCRIKLFSFLPLLKITEQEGANGRVKVKAYLFYFIPLLRMIVRK